MHEINNAQLGRLYRDRSITTDSHNYLMPIDAVGNGLRTNPIPNFGRGRPMQAKRRSSGGTARLTGPG